MQIVTFLLFFSIFLAFESAPATDGAGANTITGAAQFWAMLALVLTFVIDIIRRSVQRRWDKQDAAAKAAEVEAARQADSIRAKEERAQLAAQIKHELELQHERETCDRERNATKTIQSVEKVLEKVEENTNITVEAFKAANDSNAKLVAIGEAGLLNQEQEKKSADFKPPK